MADEVRNSGNRLTPEEIKARREEFKKIQENGHTIELTTQSDNPKNSGVSYDYMNRLNQDIEAGIFEDVGQDGFTKNEKKALGNEFDSVFTEHGYSTKFTKMKEGEKYNISYDDYVRLAKAAGYELVKEKPTQESKHDDENNSNNNTLNETVVQTFVTVEIPEGYEVEDIQVNSSIVEDPNAPKTAKKPKIETKVIYVDDDNSAQAYKPNEEVTQEPDVLPAKAHSDSESKTYKNVIIELPETTDTSEGSAVMTFKNPLNGGKVDETEQPVVPVSPESPAKADGTKPDGTEPPVTPVTPVTPVSPESPTKADGTKADGTEPPVTPVTPVSPESPAKADGTKPDGTEPPVTPVTPVSPESPTKADDTKPDGTEPPVVDNKQKSQTTYTNSEEELKAYFDNDEEMAGKTNQERAKIMQERVNNLNSQIIELERTTETYTTKKILMFGGKTKTRDLPAEVVQERQAQAAKLREDKDNLMRYQMYAKRVLADEYWNGAFSPYNLEDEHGNVLVQHGTYYKATVVDDSGTKHKVIEERKVEQQTDSEGWPQRVPVSRYYPADIQKVGNPNVGNGLYWEIVPDKEHELTNVTPTK